MKKILVTTILAGVFALAVQAAETETQPEAKPEPKAKKPALSAEHKAARKELVEKYDTNKNKRLDKDERAKMTPEDQEKWKEFSGAKKDKEAAH